MKKIFHEIGKGYLGALGAVLLAWTLAAIPAVPRLVLGLALTDTQVLYIRAGLALFGFLILAVVGWLLYFQTHRQLRLVQVSLAVPRKVTDDYEHLKDRAFWVHRKTGDRVCGSCLVSHGIVSPLAVAVKMRVDRSKYLVWRCGRKECGITYAKWDSDT